MVSIIISSYQNHYFENISKNISQTIGCAYETIRIENHGEMSIAEAYNKGIEMSKYEILCFCHEDVLFHTLDWGKRLISIFAENERVGVVGIAGNKSYGNIPVGWFDYDYSNRFLQLLQHENGEIKKNNYGFEDAESLVEVEVLDGVLLCFEKSKNLKFNIKLKGFHAYDLAISIEAKEKGLNNFVTNEILLEHFSAGKINDDWYISMNQFYEEYNCFLKKPSKYPNESLEAYKSFIIGLHRLKMKYATRKHFHELLKIKPFDRFNLWYLLNCYFI